MPHRYSTALSHLILAGTGIYCLTAYGSRTFDFPQVSFGTIVANSLLGVWRWGNPDYGEDADGVYRITTVVQSCFALPCITTITLLGYGYMWEAAYACTFASLLPLVAYLGDRENPQLLDLIIAVDSIALGVVTFMKQNYFGVAAAVSYAVNHFIIRNEGDFMDMPSIDLYNYGLCFYAFFALRTITDNLSVSV